MTDVNFKVSSGLKNIIGRELITDDFIAVFELVKNAFDAHSKRVDITFDGLDTDSPTLSIRDNGKGMSRKDLKEKWLFVAYSAKKEGTEDYRQMIRAPRIYAGAKGIGRFSCDKLGRHLKLISRADPNENAYSLTVDWDLFEQDAKEEFINIPVSLKIYNNPPKNLKTGTILRITGLRESWDREKLLKLKRSLEKLINPNQGNDANSFSVYLRATSELEKDKEIAESEPWNRVNGKIDNFLFEELKIKSTHIHISIPRDGKHISTRLEDRGKFIYEIIEENDFNLHSIDVDLFALNQSAKSTFTRRMGIQPVKFGSVFLFKNGFRIYPFGEEGEDSWGIDRRKAQGHSRFLGTRDLIGRVEINGDNPGFKEATSRDGGLIETAESETLKEFFQSKVLRRLELFAIDVIKYGNKELPEGEYESKSLELILQLTRSRAIKHVEYNPNLIDILNEASEKSLGSLISQFREIAEKADNPQLERDAKKAERRMRELERAREEAEEAAGTAEEERKKAEQEAEEQRKQAEKAKGVARKAEKKAEEFETQNLFLQSLVSADTVNLVGLHHHIGIAASTIQNHIQAMTKRIRSGKPVSVDMFLSTLEKISLQASQISSSAKFATKANFSMEAAVMEGDIVSFMREYILNVCQGSVFTSNHKEVEFRWHSAQALKLVRKFRPFEVVVLIDNLINNSKKAGAKKIDITALGEGGSIKIRIRDDGKGISETDRKRIFDLGYTTTSGSGFGLYHASKIAENMGGTLQLTKSSVKGAEFEWEIPQ